MNNDPETKLVFKRMKLISLIDRLKDCVNRPDVTYEDESKALDTVDAAKQEIQYIDKELDKMKPGIEELMKEFNEIRKE